MNEKSKLRRLAPGRGLGEAAVIEHLARVKLLCIDVDGVLTDGGLYYTDDGHIQRKYNVKDGVGIKQALDAGVEIAIVSAGVSGSVPARAKTLGIKHVFTGADDKLAVVSKLAEDLGISLEATAHIGDDLNDVPLMEVVGVAITVADAEPAAWAAAAIITERPGGDGAVREICDLLVKAHRGTVEMETPTTGKTINSKEKNG
jgi:3-deoxy-D-manno-octulosonate 8-phosphate phosphatase (KDO 8-P phosphatase)